MVGGSLGVRLVPTVGLAGPAGKRDKLGLRPSFPWPLDHPAEGLAMDQGGRPSSPSLNALRAFEAAARHGGYVGAARELHVTPAAIGTQVKGLEAWLGRPLFHRLPNGLVLTPEGRAALPALSAAFDALNGAVRGMRAIGRPRSLTLAALPCIAQLWLAPRLPALQAAFDLDVTILTRDEQPDYDRDLVDLGLYVGDAAPAGCTSVVLARDDLYPVCTPALAAGLHHPDDLAGRRCCTIRSGAGTGRAGSPPTARGAAAGPGGGVLALQPRPRRGARRQRRPHRPQRARCRRAGGWAPRRAVRRPGGGGTAAAAGRAGGRGGGAAGAGDRWLCGAEEPGRRDAPPVT